MNDARLEWSSIMAVWSMQLWSGRRGAYVDLLSDLLVYNN